MTLTGSKLGHRVNSEITRESAEVRRPEFLVGPGHTLATVTDKISSIVLTHGTPRGWWVGFAISFALLMLLQ